MTAILGISAFYHDSAAALVVDGAVVAAAQEERFTRVKHDHGFPTRSAAWCLSHAGLTSADLDYVAFYDKPLLKFERLLETYLAYAPAGFPSFVRAMPLWLKQKLHLPTEMRRGLARADALNRGEAGWRHARARSCGYGRRFVFMSHHESHAASAFLPSPFDEAAVLTVDGVGEWATASVGVGRGGSVELLEEMRFPHSLGLLYSAFTSFCGFRVNSGEYKLMGLAPFGEPRYADVIQEKLVEVHGDGSIRLDLSYFTFPAGLRMTGRRFARLFGGPAREPESPITRREMDLAASVQRVTEEVMLKMASHAHARTSLDALCLAGGVALNCVANGRIAREGPFSRLWMQPASGDAGGALGAALYVWHALLGNGRASSSPDGMSGALLGPEIGGADAERALLAAGVAHERIDDEEELCERVAGLIASGMVVGWARGRMEFGPRALGSRSILGDPRDPEAQSVMNVKIKFRESFRPFAPSVLRERAAEWFGVREGEDSPYMLLVAPVSASKRVSEPAGAERSGLDRVKAARSLVPAVTHVDGSARLQTVDGRHGAYRRLIEAFERRTGCPMVINTSFNVRGEPIVRTAEDALRCFTLTAMDALVVGPFLVLKDRQSGSASEAEMLAHAASFAPD